MPLHEEIFPWDSNFSTGIDMIDNQHQKLVDLVNKLANHLAYESVRLELDQVLDELTDYTIYHFQTEEALWEKNFPKEHMTEEHKQTHQAFIDKIVAFRVEHDSCSDDTVAVDIISFLTQWLAFHILDTDRRMAEIVLALQNGMSMDQAKEYALEKMSNATHLLIKTVLKMYDSLSSRTLELIREITSRQRAEQQLRLSKKAIDSSLEAIFITDAKGIIIDANPSFCNQAGKSFELILGEDIRKIKPTLFKQINAINVWEHASKNGNWVGEIVSTTKDGSREAAWLSFSSVHNDDGETTHFAGVLSSASQILKRKHHLEIEANHDQLTGLPNRRLLNDRLHQAIEQSNRNKTILAICFLDLDGFKLVNDALGHDAGDTVLCTISNRLKALVRKVDTVARLGGDEFVLLLGDLSNEADLHLLLERALQTIQAPISIEGSDEDTHVSGSIGISTYPSDINNPEGLLKQADHAMYEAKKAGKSQFKIWQQTSNH